MVESYSAGFLELTGAGWQEWGPDVRARLEVGGPDPAAAAAAFADTLVARPVFCDLLAQTPLNA